MGIIKVSGIKLYAYHGCLEEEASIGCNYIVDVSIETDFSEAAKIVSSRLHEKWKGTQRYDRWMAELDKEESSPQERAIRWRILEVIIERDSARAQRRLVEMPLSKEEMESQEDSAIKEVAELFISREFNVPYYFGFSKLANLASSNIDQFLDLASNLFEEIVSASLLRQSTLLSPTRQQDILKKVATRRWDEIIVSIPNGRDVVRFLESVRRAARRRASERGRNRHSSRPVRVRVTRSGGPALSVAWPCPPARPRRLLELSR